MKYPNATQLEGVEGLSDKLQAETWADFQFGKKKDEVFTGLELRGQAFAEYYYLQKTGMSNLNGLVVHGAACASLLALGNMAAVGLENSYEILTKKPDATSTEPTFIGHWPIIINTIESVDKGSLPQPREHLAVPSTALITESVTEDFSSNFATNQHQNTDNDVENLIHQEKLYLHYASPDVDGPQPKNIGFGNELTLPIQIKAGQLLLDSPVQDNQPTFVGTSQPESLIELINYDGKIIATTSVDTNGNWYINLPYTLPNGHYEFSVYSTNVNGLRKLEVDGFIFDIDAIYESIEAITPPSLSLLPLFKSDSLISIMPVADENSESLTMQTLNFGLSELLSDNTTEIFSNVPDVEGVLEMNESALHELIHPEGGITLWLESEGSALDYSASMTRNDLDELLTNQLSPDP